MPIPGYVRASGVSVPAGFYSQTVKCGSKRHGGTWRPWGPLAGPLVGYSRKTRVSLEMGAEYGRYPVGVVGRFCPARPNGGVRELVTWCDLGTGGYPSQWCGWVILGKLWLVKTGGVKTGEKCPFLAMCGLVESAFLLVFIARR